MLKDNDIIKLTGKKAIQALIEIEYTLISLRDIARYYYHGADSNGIINPDKHLEYCIETTRFIDENNITQRLAKVRKIISEKFNDELGDDDMSDIEREMEKIKYWEKPGD